MKICTHVISDRLYFVDNLLGLLSNAVKYSDRGATIEVHIESNHVDPIGAISSYNSFVVLSQANSPTITSRKRSSGYISSMKHLGPMLVVRVVDSGIGLSGILDNNIIIIIIIIFVF